MGVALFEYRSHPMSPALTDGVVTIRPMTLADVPPHVEGDDDEQARWLMAGRHSTTQTTSEWVRRNAEAWAAGGKIMNFGVVEVCSNALVGFVEAHAQDGAEELDGVDPGEANVAYGIYPAFRRKGYASRAVALMTSFLASRGFRRAVIRADPANAGSIAVARSCGFSPRGRITTKSGEALAVFKKETDPAEAPGSVDHGQTGGRGSRHPGTRNCDGEGRSLTRRPL
ncbi:MAG: GNAT family N-acetyltransferase [Candidatus Dormibacteraeota bacterium]|nr:GNAT family N-acetyltransferase [Candidatus Dormibacteraeota bacterium]